jgi:hypothetical protein
LYCYLFSPLSLFFYPNIIYFFDWIFSKWTKHDEITKMNSEDVFALSRANRAPEKKNLFTMEIKLWRLESLQIQNRSCKNYYWKTIFMSTIVESKNWTINHLDGGLVIKTWDQEVSSFCSLRFEPCGCSYDDHWRLLWSLTLRLVGLVEVRASWSGYLC